MSHTPHVTRRTIIVPEGESGVTTKTIIQNVSEIATVLRPYNVYTALLTQTGTNAPVATVLENTLGGTVVWGYTSPGIYTATLSGAFTANKTWALFSPSFTDVEGSSASVKAFRFFRTSDNVVTLSSGELEGFVELSGLGMDLAYVEIRVYP